MTTKYFVNKPFKRGRTYYRPGDEITGFTSLWRYWTLLKSNYVNQVDTAGAPTIDSITPGNHQLTINVAELSDNADPFSNYEYQLDAGSWTPFDPADVDSPFVITGLTNGQAYAVRVRADNAAGVGTQSNSVSSTPRTTPSAPTALVATPGDGELSIAFTAGSDGGSAITNYEFNVDGGAYSAFSPPDTAAPVVVTDLVNDVEVTIRIRAVNAAGSGASAAVTATPTV